MKVSDVNHAAYLKWLADNEHAILNSGYTKGELAWHAATEQLSAQLAAKDGEIEKLKIGAVKMAGNFIEQNSTYLKEHTAEINALRSRLDRAEELLNKIRDCEDGSCLCGNCFVQLKAFLSEAGENEAKP